MNDSIFPCYSKQRNISDKQSKFSFYSSEQSYLLDDFVLNLSNRQWDFTIYVCELLIHKSSSFFCLTKEKYKNEQVSFPDLP